MIDDSNDETNVTHELFTFIRVSRLCKAFANNSSNNIELSKTQLSKIVQLEEFLGRHLGPLMKTCLTFMKNVLILLAKRILMSLGLTAVA